MGSIRSWTGGLALPTALALSIVGCGGGEGTNEVFEDIFGAGGEGGSLPGIEIELTDPATDEDTDTLTAGTPIEVTATVRDQFGEPIPDTVVSFETEMGLGRFNPVSGTALTDDSGTVSLSLLDNGLIGADRVVAVGAVNAQLVSGSKSFEIVAPEIRIGSGDPFVEGTLEVEVSPLSAGGTSVISARLIDASAMPFTEQVLVGFTSPCFQDDQAAFNDVLGSAADGLIDAETNPEAERIRTRLGEPISLVRTIAGTANIVYEARGCQGTDAISAAIDVGGLSETAHGSIVALSDQLGSIKFAGTDREIIALEGTGGVDLAESATLTFQVLNRAGQPVPNTLVDFSLNTDVGGITLNVDSATTDSAGEVRVTVSSGTVATSVRVTATVTVDGNTIQSQSDLLAVSDGKPDQDSFSVSAEILNPEGLDFDGKEVAITARVSDHFNNFVPDGTTVSFTAEGGAIFDSCNTVSGACSVTWASQNPRPSNGRTTILATAIGNESFTDANGNGEFDSGEFPLANDLPGEAFRDDDEDGFRDGSEPFLDFNSDGVFDGTGDGKYNGNLCRSVLPDCTPEELHVRGSIVLVMSGSNAVIDILSATPVDVTATGTATLLFEVGDVNEQPMPAGTMIDVSTGNGTIQGTSSFEVPSTNVDSPLLYSVFLEGDEDPSTGVLTITVTTPMNVATQSTITVLD